MDWLQGIFNGINELWKWVQCFFPNLWCQGSDFFMGILEEIFTVLISALGVIPIPDALNSFQWPDVGPFGYALIDLNIPQALTILSAAFTLRFLKGLIPLIRS